MAAAIVVDELCKRYGGTVAVDGVSFSVEVGDVFGLIGPNGAGKTTTTECVQGFRRPDAGSVRVLGLDPMADGRRLRQRIGSKLQEANLPGRLRVWEVVELFAAFYRRPVARADLLDRVGLTEKRGTFYEKLSGGQKQRLQIALALVNDPELVFLDELTTGLDPQARRGMWDLVADLGRRGTTVVLTTHIMDEAERLCDRVAIMDRGAIVALDSPTGLIAGLDNGLRGISFELAGPLDANVFARLPGVATVERLADRVLVRGAGDGLAGAVLGILERERHQYRDLRSTQPTLEDVFLARTGRRLQA